MKKNYEKKFTQLLTYTTNILIQQLSVSQNQLRKRSIKGIIYSLAYHLKSRTRNSKSKKEKYYYLEKYMIFQVKASYYK